MKECSRCKIEKEESEFYRDYSCKDGLKYTCIQCDKKRREELHPCRVRVETKRDYNICLNCGVKKEEKDFYKDKGKKSGHRNLCKECERAPRLCEEYRRKRNERENKLYLMKGRERKWECRRRRHKERMKNDMCYKLRHQISSIIYSCLESNNSSKRGLSILQYLPYTIQELKEHLEKQFDSNMTWENHGSYWHVDHIYPSSLLPYDSMDCENFQKCWALENLRPLEAIENIRKGNKIIGEQNEEIFIK